LGPHDNYKKKNQSKNTNIPLKPSRVLGSAVAVAFQSTFRAKMHQNDIFLFFKKYF
jgi:hypothetical protein